MNLFCRQKKMCAVWVGPSSHPKVIYMEVLRKNKQTKKQTKEKTGRLAKSKIAKKSQTNPFVERIKPRKPLFYQKKSLHFSVFEILKK